MNFADHVHNHRDDLNPRQKETLLANEAEFQAFCRDRYIPGVENEAWGDLTTLSVVAELFNCNFKVVSMH